MSAKGFELVDKGGNYLVFYNPSLKKSIGIYYDEVAKMYRFHQW